MVIILMQAAWERLVFLYPTIAAKGLYKAKGGYIRNPDSVDHIPSRAKESRIVADREHPREVDIRWS